MLKEITKAVTLVKELEAKEKIQSYVLTGAGVSKGSGIPTFRGEDGLWDTYDFEEVATLEAWMRNPTKIWKMYQEGIHQIFDAKPNAAHKALVDLEKSGYCDHIITQNVDSLHQKAGSKNVIEVHGNLARIKCIACGKSQQLNETPKVVPPMCPCGGMMRPDVILYNETLPEDEITKAFDIANRANLVLIVGTSAEVYPAAGLPMISKRKGAKIIVFNYEETEHVNITDSFIEGKSEESLPMFVEMLLRR
ncbi:MAG: SIR2 family NAD-dependent protein deacylase [Candidatus Heimdallarchaeota archaeon]